jgi:hypothetical protein
MRELMNDFDHLHQLNDEDFNRENFVSLFLELVFKYHPFNKGSKQALREMLVANGTAACVESGQNDLTKDDKLAVAFRFRELLIFTEVVDKFGAIDENTIFSELSKQFLTIICPREIIRFFHRNNNCDCLHEIYYNLKDTTMRTTNCHNCIESFDVRKVFHCECSMVVYCSRECALAHWSIHKYECKQERKWKIQGTNTK